MSNEEKILNLIDDMRTDIETIKAEIADIRSHRGNAGRNQNGMEDMETIRKMSKLLTKEEADNLAAVVHSQKAGAYA
ncbi:MAG: hypothetical protein J5963_09115 [Schwartzia sp.]|nr:hypothetical protein [Schwartzia sp. (in: firmicutes)]